MIPKARSRPMLRLPQLDGATAAWILDLCGHLERALWLAYGDQIEAHWRAAEPDQLLYGPLRDPSRSKR